MGKNERYAYLAAVRDRYRQANRKKAKAIILDEFCHVCGYNRKYAIRMLNRQRKKLKRRPGRKPVYCSAELLSALKQIWLATDQMCSKKLVAAIPLWLPFNADSTTASFSLNNGSNDFTSWAKIICGVINRAKVVRIEYLNPGM